MKKIILAFAIFLFGSQFVNAQLSVGEIAFVGMNEDAYAGTQDHSFSWISLTDIPGNEVVYFTEQGVNVNTNTWFGNTEGHYTWTAPAAGLPCGTVVYVYEDGATNNLIASYGTYVLAAGSGWNLSGGDQILAYQAASVKPASILSATFISGIHKESDQANGETNSWTTTTYNSTGTGYSHLPPGLTSGVNCISLFDQTTEYDNVKYTGTLTGTSTTLLGLINNKGNWDIDLTQTTAQNITVGSYSPNVTCVAACSDPTIPTVTASASPICPSANSILNITGTLNDATAWHIYTGSCGGTALTTTTGTSVVVSPSFTTTYYIRGEGGCVTPGSCGTVIVTVADNTDPVITVCASTPANISANASCQGTTPDLTGSITATDNCTASPTITQSPTAGATLGLGVTTITLTATDAAGNTATCQVNQTVVDNTNPTVSCQPITVQLDGTGNVTVTATQINNGSSDNCGAVTLGISDVGTICGTANEGGTVTITAPVGAVITSINFASYGTPNGSCGSFSLGGCHAAASITIVEGYALGQNSVSIPALNTVFGDPCGGTGKRLYVEASYTAVTSSPSYNFTCTDVGSQTLNLLVTDGSGNTANCDASVTVEDNIAPVITVCASTPTNINSNGACQGIAPDLTGSVTATDNCTGSPVITQSPAAGVTLGLGTTSITLTATDGSGNTSTCTVNQTVVDNADPVIVVCASTPANISANGSCQGIAPDLTGGVTATDNCTGSPVITQSPVAGTTLGLGTTTITLTATDGSGNTSTCTVDQTVVDNTDPIITVCASTPANISANVNCQGIAPDLTGGVTATDNCTGSPTITQSPAAGATLGLGITTITLTATDGSGNTSTCTVDQTVVDNTNPTITCPGNQTEILNISCGFVLPDYTSLATVSDNCTASPVVSQSPVVGTVISGTTTVTLTVTDGSSNTEQCSFDVILSDLTAPIVSCQDVNAYLDGAGNAIIVASDIDGGSTDNCSSLTLAASQTTFTCLDLGVNTVTLTATDGNSNISSCAAIVTVVDTISPVINCLGNQTDIAATACQLTLPDYTVSATVIATDNCATLPIITQSPVAGISVGVGVTVITLTADDGNGNTTSCSFDLTVSSSTTGTLDSTLCYGESFTFNGTIYDESNTSGVETLIGAATNGCDSLVNVTVTVLTEIDMSVTNASPLLAANQAGATYQWMVCEDEIIADETNQNFIANTNGDYAVIISLSGCSDTSVCETVTGVGVAEYSLFNDVYIYPNPNQGKVNIELGSLKNVTVRVFTLTGELIYSKENITTAKHQLELNEAGGVYFVEVNSNDKKQRYKLIIE